MAPVTDASYFPPLERCLAGDNRLISWRTAYRALCDEDSALSNSNLEQFLNDNETVALLSKPLDPFQGPSQRSAQEFDTRTAPINVSQSNNGHYKLDEIKADAKWLSQEMKVDELVALRMAVIEWQERAADQLLTTALNPASSLSTQVALASSTLGRSFNFAASTTGPSSRPALDFASEDVRRRRLVELYLSEKYHLLKLSTGLVSRSAVRKSEYQGQHIGAFLEHSRKNWVDELSTKVFEAMVSAQVAEHEAFCAKCIDSIESILDRGQSQAQWPKWFQDNPGEAEVYVASQYTELVALLRLLLANLYTLETIPGPAMVKKWFSVMASCGYLQGGNTVFVDSETAALLISVISVDILKLELAIAELGEMVESPGSRPTQSSSYFMNDGCLAELSERFHEAATSRLNCAAPAIYAWAILASLIGDVARTFRDTRIEAAVQVKDLAAEFEKLYDRAIVIPEWESNSTTPREFMHAAVHDMNVYNLIAVLCDSVNATFGSAVESTTAFIYKETLLDLIRNAFSYVTYGEPILNAILSILTPAEFCNSSLKHSRILAGKVFHEPHQFQPQIIEQTLYRYPYELSPFLRLFTALSNVRNENGSSDDLPTIVTELDTLHYYTQVVDKDFSHYTTILEHLGANEIELNANLDMFIKREGKWQAQGKFRPVPHRTLPSTTGVGEPWREVFVPAGTTGRVISSNKPFVLFLRHEHSGLEYLGLLLSSFTPNGDVLPAESRSRLNPASAAEIVSLFTSLLSATLDQSNNNDDATDFLRRLSATLRNEQDIVSVISEVLETELMAHLDQKAVEGSLDLVIACIQFLIQLVKILPERVWSILVRSSLLGVQDGAVSLASVVGGTEILTHRYRFLNACTQLHASLLDDAISGLVKRKVVASKSTSRFAQDDDVLDVTPDRTMSAVLNSYQKILLGVLQNLPDWKFDVRQERCSIAINILESFSKLLRSTYGVDVAKDPSKRLTSVLAPAAESLLSACAPQTGPIPLVAAFGRLLPEALPIAEDSLPVHIRGLLIEQSKSSFRFLTLLIRIARGGIDLLANTKDRGQTAGKNATEEQKRKAAEQRARTLATDMANHFPTLASLLVSDHSLKEDLFPLLSEVVQAIGSGDEEPPSILAQLDTEAQTAFLSVTTQLDRPLCDVQVERRIWDFLSDVMSSKQHWFATFLLTGELPRKGANRQGSGHARAKSILTFVLDQLSSISILPPERANGMLKFVATAQQVWVWANTEIRSHADFLKETLAWIDKLGVAPRDPSPGASIISAKECEMASYLCNIYAISIHAGLETGDKTVLQSVLQKLTFLRKHGVTVNAYNRSLHRNLKENLSQKFPQSDLSDFKRTEVNPATPGPEFFYDRGFANSVFSHDVSWRGGSRSRSQGFSDEFARANANLSLLHAQKKLLKSWKTLAITICELADQEPSSHSLLAEVAKNCLEANANPQLEDEPGTADLLEERIELAFVLCSKVVTLKVQDPVAKELLKAAWELVRTSPVDYDIASAPEDVHYYRELLQVLYLAIQPHSFVEQPTQAQSTALTYLKPEVGSILVDIVDKVVAPGFRALCGNIHTNAELALPADFAVLTALLQSVISTPGVRSVYTLLSNIVADTSLVRGALSLYSWSDQLAEATAHEPIFGEVAAMFLLALSTVPPIAEQMALAGVLTQLSASNLSSYFRKPGGKGPFDEPYRMFVIWSEAFLPLCLNLLDAVGPPIAGEVGAFLNSFPEQLRRAERALRNETPGPRNPRAGSVTLGLVAEANSLGMISVILSSDVARAAAEGINAADVPSLEYDVESVKALMEALSRTRNLSERLTPVNALEERWMKMSIAGGGNALMGKALKEIKTMLALFEASSP